MGKDGKEVQVEIADAWAVRPIEEGALTVLVFETQSGTRAFSFDAHNLSRFTEDLLREMSRQTATQTPEFPPKILAANPVPVTSLGFAPHPEDSSSVLLSMAVGNFQITFQVDGATLVQTCKTVLASTTVVKPRSSH
jgi:hypothetical protein